MVMIYHFICNPSHGTKLIVLLGKEDSSPKTNSRLLDMVTFLYATIEGKIPEQSFYFLLLSCT